MLAQGQSSSAKRGGLAADVSSGLIFLKKKKDELVEPSIFKRKKGGLLRAETDVEEKGKVGFSGDLT